MSAVASDSIAVTAPVIEARDIHKAYAGREVLRGVSLSVAEGETVVLIGPSGSGKTTLLRMIAGLEQPDEGSVLFHGEDATEVSVRERNVGFVFQHYALFGHMTVADNIAFGLRVRPRGERPARSEIASRVEELLTLVQLEGLGKRYPSQLSGGQRQRIAIARAILKNPRLLLLDEATSSLDTESERLVQEALERLMQGRTTFVVAHRLSTIQRADRILVLDKGRVVEQGTHAQLLERKGLYHYLYTIRFTEHPS